MTTEAVTEDVDDVGAADLVNIALLGTDRRPPDTALDPARWLLDRAVRRRMVTQVGARVGRCPPAETGPSQELRLPPASATELLDEMLVHRAPLPVNLWLGEAVTAGCGLSPEHWVPVLELAARQTSVDRRALVAALGQRGLWFARQHAGWARLLAGGFSPTKAASATDAGLGVIDLEVLTTNPDRLFAVPDPWGENVCRAALDLLAAGLLPGRAATAYGAAVGSRLPLAHRDLVAEVVQRSLTAPARLAVTALDDVVRTRLLLRQAFSPVHSSASADVPVRSPA